MKKIIIIAGPTGVGKSDFAELLAQRIDGEIVNADQGQLYEPLSIGTAKPSWKKNPVRHHLFDLVIQPRHYTTAEYQKEVMACINEIHSRSKRAVIVGGSGFYYQMVLFNFLPLPEKLPPATQATHQRTWDHLRTIDPLRAAAIHPNDQYRIERALEIFYTHGITPSSVGLRYHPYHPYLLIHVNRTTDDLYQRINNRTESMINAGWLQETAELPKHWKDFLAVKKTIGYNEILAYQEKKIDFTTMIALIQQKTRTYAKRQRTYFRTLLKKIPTHDHQYIQEINLTLSPVDLYLNQLIKHVD